MKSKEEILVQTILDNTKMIKEETTEDFFEIFFTLANRSEILSVFYKAMESHLQSRRVSDEEIDEMFPTHFSETVNEMNMDKREGARQLRDKIFK